MASLDSRLTLAMLEACDHAGIVTVGAESAARGGRAMTARGRQVYAMEGAFMATYIAQKGRAMNLHRYPPGQRPRTLASSAIAKGIAGVMGLAS
jgi:hypothetical protein